MYFLKAIVFWDVTPCNLTDKCELLRGITWVEASGSAKMLVFVHKRFWSQSHHENLISSSVISVLSDTDTCWVLPAFSFGLCTFPILLYDMYVSCHRHFFLVLLLNQRWSPPLRLQASHCSTFCIMCDAPSIAVFYSESIECFLGTVSKFFLKLLDTIPVAPVITGTIVHLLLLSSSSVSYVQPFCFVHFLFNSGLSFSMHSVNSYFLEICSL